MKSQAYRDDLGIFFYDYKSGQFSHTIPLEFPNTVEGSWNPQEGIREEGLREEGFSLWPHSWDRSLEGGRGGQQRLRDI